MQVDVSTMVEDFKRQRVRSSGVDFFFQILKWWNFFAIEGGIFQLVYILRNTIILFSRRIVFAFIRIFIC